MSQNLRGNCRNYSLYCHLLLCLYLLPHSPLLLYFGLLTGATLGGNITPIGASANIAAIGILRRQGHEVSTHDFMRIGLPFTLAAVMTGYLFCWFVWR